LKNIVEELKWRGLIHDIIPGTEEQLIKESTTCYIGFDPTSDSLHIGSLVPIILLKHMKNFGHNPIALVGGATGMIGDPSGKSNERNLLDEETLSKNIIGIKNTLNRFLDDTLVVNNYDWMSKFSFIDFVRDIGKRITVNYMMSKQSVKNRIDGEGMSFTEFTYQLIQGYDFYHLNKEHNCLLQMGGSDQWGNITTGTELIHKMDPNKKVFAMTCPLLTKSDGSKFGKSEGGTNIWLDKDKTSVYKFYQFWLNTDDKDVERYIKIFTFLEKETIDNLITEHNKSKHLFLLQKTLAREVTILVHGEEEFKKAFQASGILFGDSSLNELDEETFIDVFNGVPQVKIQSTSVVGSTMVEILTKTGFLKSNGDARRALKENSISVNKERVTEDYIITEDNFINNKFIVLQRGKKNYFVINTENEV
jgi:tyrosyl-tRNA synthetase